jgi:hypothetical protein
MCDRLTGVKKLRGRGFKALRFCAKMKAAGLNLLRVSGSGGPRGKNLTAKKGRFGVISRTFTVFKERVQAGVTNFGLIFRKQPAAAPCD